MESEAGKVSARTKNARRVKEAIDGAICSVWYGVVALTVALGGLGLFCFAEAQEEPLPLIESVSCEEVGRILHEAGYRAELGKDRRGDPLVRSSTGGSRFSVLFSDSIKGGDGVLAPGT